jgi:steroid delta-isomerase
MPNEPTREIARTLERYAACITAKDIAGIVGLYADDATIEIPVGGAVHRGIDAIRAFYTGNELAERVEITGPVCAAASEAAVPMRATIRRDGHSVEIDVIDVVRFDARGRLRSLRAFFDLAGARPLP